MGHIVQFYNPTEFGEAVGLEVGQIHNVRIRHVVVENSYNQEYKSPRGETVTLLAERQYLIMSYMPEYDVVYRMVLIVGKNMKGDADDEHFEKVKGVVNKMKAMVEEAVGHPTVTWLGGTHKLPGEKELV